MLQLGRRNLNILVALVALLFCAATFGAPIVVSPSRPSVAQLDVISDTPSETVLELQFGTITVDTVQYNAADWVTLNVAGMQMTSRSGWPQLPQYSAWIHASSASRLEILESEQSNFLWGNVLPAPEPLIRSANSQLQRITSPDFYDSAAAYPESPASLSVQGNLRGANVALVTFIPVQFNPESGECTVHTRLRVRITHERNSLDQTAPQTRSAHYLFERLLATHRDSEPTEATGSPRYLIVTEPPFLTALQPLIEWKVRSGLPVGTIIYSDVATSADELRSHLLQYADSAEQTPEYLLIVGDVNVVPAFFGVGGSLTDHPFSTLFGDDYLPDISVGRIPCQTALECAAWVDRLLAYERDGVINGAPNSTVFSSSAALDPLHGTTVQGIFNSAGFAPDWLQEPQSGSLQLLMNSLNSGREWIFYIGHGFPQAWSSVSPVFGNGQAHEVQSATASIVISVACATADLDFPGSSIGEHWLTEPTSAGPLAYLGATEPTAFFRSDTIGLGAVRAVFEQQILRFGEAVDFGKLATAQAFPQPSGGLTEETIQQFILLGDPAMRVFSAAPRALDVSYPATVPLSVSHVSFTVQSNNQAFADADICVASESGDFYEVRHTDASGEVDIPIALTDPAVLNVTITGDNAIPYLGSLHVIPPDGPFLQLAGIEVLDPNGDADGRADRGEMCELRIALANLGNLSSVAGLLTVTTNDARLQVNAVSIAVPAIESTDTVWCEATVTVIVSDTVADLSAPLLALHVQTDDGTDFTTYRPLLLHAPELLALDHTVIELSGDGDGQPEADEDLQLQVLLRNIGSDRVAAAAIHLSSASSYVSIINADASTGAVAEGEILTAEFDLHASPVTPRGEAFTFEYSISAANVPEYSGSGMVRIGQIPVFLYELDEQPDQMDAVASALDALGLEYERSTQLPPNLTPYRSVWVFCGTFPNQTVLSDNDGEQLAEYLLSGGNCYLEGGDTWAFDPPTDLHPLFHITGMQDGSSNAGPFIGEYGSAYQEYAFAYVGENMFVDQLAPGPGGMVMLRNDHSGAEYPVCIAYAGDDYRTIGSSVELGSVVDVAFPSTRVHLISDICAWFGIISRADIFPPVIAHEPVAEFNRLSVPIPIAADLQDASGISSAEVIYRLNDGAENSAPLDFDNGLYRALLPGARLNDVIHYRLRAGDNSDLHTSAETEEFSTTVVVRETVPIGFDFPGISRLELSEFVESGENTSWAVVDYPAAQTSLELHGARDSRIAFTTLPFDIKGVASAQLTFTHFLRMNQDPNASVRVFANVSGSAQPVNVWSLTQQSESLTEEGEMSIPLPEPLANSSEVTLRFEFRGDGYWRIGDVQIIRQSTPPLVPLGGVTIDSHDGELRLNWKSVQDAGYYVINASSAADSGHFVPIATTRDTTFADPDVHNYNFRLYSVQAAVKSVETPLNRVAPAVLQPVDEQWNVRSRRTQ